ncbi:MAG: HD domain-containing protein [Pseudobdellovibrionaceae bacterium]
METNSKIERLALQILELDKLKTVLRRTLISDSSRRENSAEHSWHLAMAVLLFQDLASREVDILKAVKMALIHDIVEIDAGDTFVYDQKNMFEKLNRERKAAERLFLQGSKVPQGENHLGREFYDLWEEYEEGTSPEALYLTSLDRFLPVLLNVHTKGHAWQTHGVKFEQVLAFNRKIENGIPELWVYAEKLIKGCHERGYL